MITEPEIRAQLALYLRGKNSLDQFEDWFAESSWNMHKDSSGEAQHLASQIELRLAEHSSGHLPEDELRKELRQHLIIFEMPLSFGGQPELLHAQKSQNTFLRNVRVIIPSVAQDYREIPAAT